jgi:Ohr subfamily peroxiredoxin
MEKIYTTRATSAGDGRAGQAELADGSLALRMAVPVEMGGSGDGANPEQLFALGYAACFHGSLKLAGSRLKKRVGGSTVTAEVTLGQADDAYLLAVTLTAAVPQLPAADVRELLELAHEICPYSRATRGNIEVTLEVG